MSGLRGFLEWEDLQISAEKENICHILSCYCLAIVSCHDSCLFLLLIFQVRFKTQTHKGISEKWKWKENPWHVGWRECSIFRNQSKKNGAWILFYGTSQSGHRLPALGNGTRLEGVLEGQHWGVATSSSFPLSNVCAPWARLQCFLKMLVLYSERWAPLPLPPQKANAVKKPETKS